jgi:DNA-binding GntR family transcriptional regulator
VTPSLVDLAFSWLANRITNGTLRPGEPLSEQAIVNQVGVSRTPVREALRRLERDGLVRIVPGRGAYVAHIAEREVREIYVCRAYLEGLAAKLAAANMTPAALEQLRTAVEEMGQAAAQENLQAFFRANVAFHNLKWQVANNQVLQGLLESLGLRVLRLRYLSMGLPNRMETSYRVHQEILEAFERRDGDAAEAGTREVISTACTAILRFHFGITEHGERPDPGHEIAEIGFGTRGTHEDR